MHTHASRTSTLFFKTIQHCVTTFFQMPCGEKKEKRKKEKKRRKQRITSCTDP